MKPKTAILIVAVLIFFTSPGLCLEPNQIVTLKAAGISDETISVIMREKSIATSAFTVDEIIQMKRSGIGEQTLQMIITQGSFAKDRQDVVYGENTRTLKNLRVKDVITLKEKGVSDQVIQSVIEAGFPTSDEKDREKAWDMLNQMGIIQKKYDEAE